MLMRLPDAEFDLLLTPPPSDADAVPLPPLVNIGCGVDITVRQLAETIARVVGYCGELKFDAAKPDGTPRKLLEISRIQRFGWRPKIGLRDGIGLAYQAYQGSLKT